MHTFQKIDYKMLNSRQQENYNFQKVSGVLADYGFVTLRLTDDWQGADFIAQHISGEFLKVQLKGRLCFYKKYQGKDLYLCFRECETWYLFPHDEVLTQVSAMHPFLGTSSWTKDGFYTFPSMSENLRTILRPYQLT